MGAAHECVPVTGRRLWLGVLWILILQISAWVGPVVAEETGDTQKPPPFAPLIGTLNEQETRWTDAWLGSRTGMGPAGLQVLSLATDKRLSRSEFKTALARAGEGYKKLRQNADVGRHEVLKDLIARALVRTNEKLAKAGRQPLDRVLTLNSGKTGDFSRDIDLTVSIKGDSRELMFLYCLAEVAEQDLHLEVHPPAAKRDLRRGLSLPQLEVELMRGSLDLPDAREARDIQTFALDYRGKLEAQAQNPECYWGYGFEMEVAGRRELTFKPGQTYIQEFTTKGVAVEYTGRIASSTAEVKAALGGTAEQRWRRSQHAIEIANHYMQGFGHFQHGQHDSQGPLKYAGRSVDDLCAAMGYATWDKLCNEERLDVLRAIGVDYKGQGGPEKTQLVCDAVTAARETFYSKDKKVPAQVDGKPVDSHKASILALLFMRRAAAATAAMVAEEMFCPPAYHPAFEAEQLKNPAWRNMTEEQRRAIALQDPRNRMYRACMQVEGMENLIMLMRQLRRLDHVQPGQTPGSDAIDIMLRRADCDPRVREALQLAADHADAVMRFQKPKDAADRNRARQQMDETRRRLAQVIRAPMGGEEVVRRAASTDPATFLKVRGGLTGGGDGGNWNNAGKWRGARGGPGATDGGGLWTAGARETYERLQEHVLSAFPSISDEIRDFRAKVQEHEGMGGYAVQRMFDEMCNLGTLNDLLQVIEMYQNNAAYADYGKFFALNVMGRMHWSLGFLGQAALVRTEKDLMELGKSIALDALCRVVPGVGQVKLVFDIERGVVVVTVGYAINRMNADLIDVLYTGEAGRRSDAMAGTVAGAKRDFGQQVLSPECVIRKEDEKTGKREILIDRGRVYRDFFKDSTTYAYNHGVGARPAITNTAIQRFVTAHDRVLKLMLAQSQQQEPAWLLAPGATWKPPAAVHQEDMDIAMQQLRDVLMIAVVPRCDKALEQMPREYIVKNAQDEKVDAIAEGLRERYVTDILTGMVDTWKQHMLEQALAKREIEAMADAADVNTLAKWLAAEMGKPTTRPAEGRFRVTASGGRDLAGNVFDESEPLLFECKLVTNGIVPRSMPDCTLSVDFAGPPVRESGTGPLKPGDIVVQEVLVRAVCGGIEIGTEKVRVRIRKGEGAGAPLLQTREVYWGAKTGPLEEKYTYYDEAAMKHPSMRSAGKWQAVGGKVYHGTYTQYHDNGKKKRQTAYRYGVKHGVETYHDRDENVLMSTTYAEGLKHGPCVNYNNDLTVHDETTYDKDLATLAVTYWDDGKVKSRVTQQRVGDGVISGLLEAYWSNRNLEQKGQYRTVTEDAKDKSIRAGKQGTWVSYHENGKLRESGDYRDDMRQGEWTFGDENGKITHWVTYKDGSQVSTRSPQAGGDDK